MTRILSHKFCRNGESTLYYVVLPRNEKSCTIAYYLFVCYIRKEQFILSDNYYYTVPQRKSCPLL